MVEAWYLYGKGLAGAWYTFTIVTITKRVNIQDIVDASNLSWHITAHHARGTNVGFTLTRLSNTKSPIHDSDDQHKH